MPNLSQYQPLLKEFNSIFRQVPDLSLDYDPTRNITKVMITFYLKAAYYGDTKIRVREWYDSRDTRLNYRYCWEKNSSRPGHISAWEDEHPHRLDTDPHHHHHVPGSRSRVQDNYHTRDLRSVLMVVKEYIDENKEYDGRMV